MDQAPQLSDQKSETRQAKKEYHTPELREYGTVADLTQSNANGAPLDTGAPPNIYLTGRG